MMRTIKTKFKLTIVAVAILVFAILSIELNRSVQNIYAQVSDEIQESQHFIEEADFSNQEILAMAAAWREDSERNVLPPLENEQPIREQGMACFAYENIMAFGEFLRDLGYNLNCQHDLSILEPLMENYYNQAIAGGIIVPFCDNAPVVGQEVIPLWLPESPGFEKMDYNNGNTNFGTHQTIAARAYDYASNRFPNLFAPRTNMPASSRGRFVRYSDWADTPDSGQRGPQLGMWTNNSHFYHPRTSENFFRNLQFGTHNARNRTEYFFNRAVAFYPDPEAFSYLGKASHFLTDLTSPGHTGDRLPDHYTWLMRLPPILRVTSLTTLMFTTAGELGWQGINHRGFERVAQEEVLRILPASFVVNSNHRTTSVAPALAQMHPYNIAGFIAAHSYTFYNQVGGTLNFVSRATRVAVAEQMLALAVHANAAMLMQFAQAIGHTEESPPHFVDGTLLQNRGSIFVAAGGAPLFVTDWNRIGGFRPYINITDAQLRMMQRTPVDGTLVWESSTNTTYVFAGGAPLFISSMNISGRPVTRVDFAALFATSGYLRRVNQHPADGTLVWEAVTNTTYIFAGGAPLFVTNLDLIGGYRPSTQVDFLALFTPSSHLSRVRSHPIDGTFVTTMQGSIFRFTNGQAFRVNSWDEVGGIQHNTLVDEHAFAVYGRSEGVYVLTLKDLILQNWHLVAEFLLWEQQNLGWMNSVR